MPDYYLESSNLFSQSEVVLLRWLEINFEFINPVNPRRFTNFDKDLKDCLAYRAVLLNYIGSPAIEKILNLKFMPVTDDDYRYNVDRILMAMNEIGL